MKGLIWPFILSWLFATPALADCNSPANDELHFSDGEIHVVGKIDTAEEVNGDIDSPGVAIGEQFSLVLGPCDADTTIKQVDARMPQHGHGMNYKPRLSPQNLKQIKAEGMLFHMPGLWEIIVDVKHRQETRRLTIQMTVNP